MDYNTLISTLASLLKSHITAERFKQLKGFELRIGVRRNLNNGLIQQQYALFQKDHPEFQQIELLITLIEKTIQCEWCAMTSKIENDQNVCVYCGKETEIELTGNELGIGRLIFNSQKKV